MKLFVDDNRQPWPGWERARTITEAIRLISGGWVESVSLDHDIACYLVGGQQHSSQETFEPVARYIALWNSSGVHRAIGVQFHTGNLDGGRHMADILKVITTGIKSTTPLSERRIYEG